MHRKQNAQEVVEKSNSTVIVTASPSSICSSSQSVNISVSSTHHTFDYYNSSNGNILCNNCTTNEVISDVSPGTTIVVVILVGSVTIGSGGPDAAASANPTTINVGANSQLSASGGSSYRWSPTGSLSNSNIYNPIASPASSTTYTVTVTDAQGCEDIASITVTVDDSQVPDTDNCPTTPSNDDPCGATLLNVETTATYTQGNNYCATNSSIPNLTCDGYSYGDIWYRFTMPPSGFVAITMTKSSLINDMGMGIYTGSCNSPAYYGCFQNTNPDIGLYMPSAVINDIAPGTPVLIRLWEFGNNDFGPFGINILDLGTVINPDDLPDLAVVVNSVSDVTPNQAQNINVNFTVNNNSNVGTTNDILCLMWLSNDPIWSLDDAVFPNSAAALSGLGGNNSESFNFNDAVPNVEDGLYYVIVTVDVVLDNVYESNEFNNYYAFPVTVGNVEPTGADLRIRNEEVSPYSNVAPGMDIELTCDVENDGNERTESGGRIAFYFSEDDDFEPGIDLFLGYQSFGRLDPGEDSYEDITIEAPQVSSTGSKRIFYYVDYENDVDEYDETNNLDYENIHYNTTQPILPDYVGDSITIEQGGVLTNTLVPDEDILIRAVVTNEGTKDASSSSRAYFYYSRDTDFNNNNKYLGYSHLHRLDIGEMDDVIEGDYFNGVQLGQGYILIILDGDNEVPEEDEFNNRIIVPINVVEGDNPLPDVTIQINEISQYTNSLGDVPYLDLTIQNIASGIATSFYVDFFLSNEGTFYSN